MKQKSTPEFGRTFSQLRHRLFAWRLKGIDVPIVGLTFKVLRE